MSTRVARRLAGAVAALVVLAACSSNGGDASKVLDPRGEGLVLIDCWHDVAYPVDADTGKLGRKGALFAKPDSTVAPAEDCYRSNSYGPGVSTVSSDGVKRAATKSSTADGARHVGYVDVSTGTFTDLSKRLKLDAFGELTDAGSAADDFAGPIKDELIGFGADGEFYLRRADSVFAAAGPSFEQFAKLEAAPLLGVRFDPSARLAALTYADQVLVELSADTPLVEPYGGSTDRYLGEDARYAPLIFSPADTEPAPSHCVDLQWVDATHLLCIDSEGLPGLIDFTAPTLARAADYAQARGCGDCYGREYVWLMPEGSYRALVPKTQRDLSGFLVEPGTGQVLFLAANGDDIRLYGVGSARGATPQIRGAFSLGDSSPPGADYLTLRWR
jgi:hypothetical protein